MNKMLEIPKIEDKSEALRIYLEANKNDYEGDNWAKKTENLLNSL